MLNTERIIYIERKATCNGTLLETTSVNNPFGGNECGFVSFNNADNGKTMKLEITS